MSTTENNNTEKFTIVKLMKNNTVEYPVTRPECVIFKDGTTVASHITSIENGVDLTNQTYQTGCDVYLGSNVTNVVNVPMFSDKDIFHAYQAINLDNMKKSYYAITCNNVVNRWYPFKTYDIVGDYTNGANVLGVIENEGDNKVHFSLKHFASLMYGYAPQSIRITSGTNTPDIVYDKLISMNVENVHAEDIGGDSGNLTSVKVIKLVMGKNDSNANPNDICEFYISPSIKKDLIYEVDGEPVVYGDGYFPGCFVKNSYIEEINQIIY